MFTGIIEVLGHVEKRTATSLMVRAKIPKPKKTTPPAAKDHKAGSAVLAVDMSHPTKLMSVTTIIPCQNLR